MSRHRRGPDWVGVGQWVGLVAAALITTGLFAAYLATGTHLADIAVLFRIR